MRESATSKPRPRDTAYSSEGKAAYARGGGRGQGRGDGAQEIGEETVRAMRAKKALWQRVTNDMNQKRCLAAVARRATPPRAR